MSDIKKGALVYYKEKAAKVDGIDDKIEISFLKVKKRVRDKDILFLHPGPVNNLDDLDSSVPENLATLDETLELLEDEASTLEDLAELLFGDFTTQSALSTWLMVVDGLYFEGSPNNITVRPLEQIAEDKITRQAKQQKKDNWEALLKRIKQSTITKDDYPQLVEVEQVAVGERENSKLLKTLGIKENKESAHSLLLKLGYWQDDYNPWPRRMGATLSNPTLDIPTPKADPEGFVRHDLTHLKAWAIDDVGNQDPDDAISIEGNRIWVHIADVSAFVTPDSELDIDARSRGANLYLPDRVIHMLPTGITELCGLGLQDQSNALSISFDINDDGELENIEVCFSLLNVTRTTYGDADKALDSTFSDLMSVTKRYYQRRLNNNASTLDFPEVNIHVVDGVVSITPYGRSGSRQLVTDCMLAAGEAVALFAIENDIAIPYASQPEPEKIRQTSKLSEHYEYRRQFKPSSHTTSAAAHFGLGLPCYTRVTSPIRRYLDLVVHQQLRAFVSQQPLLTADDLVERIGLADEAGFATRKAERFSRQFWTMQYLKQNPDWKGEAIVMAQDDRKNTVVLPALAFETKLSRKGDFGLDETIDVQLQSVNIVDLMANFKS
jgi:exoribonuclease-2